MYISVCDNYTPTSEEYHTIDDFLNMCEACFGNKPELYEQNNDYYEWQTPPWFNGDWKDARINGIGSQVLVLQSQK